MKVWNKSNQIDKTIENFTIGNDPEFDLILAKYDVEGSMAHVRMLIKTGLILPENGSLLIEGLKDIKNDIEKGDFYLEKGMEDVHSQIEYILTLRYGEVGKMLHTGRSRNDQIATDLKLYYRDQLKLLAINVKALASQFLAKASNTSVMLMPGYTHSQAGMVSSFGLWYASFAESLADDLHFLQSVFEISDQNPLGTAAGYGSSLPLDREFTTEALQFSGMIINPIYAQASRGRTEWFIACALSSLCLTLNRFSGDVCIYSNENYNFLKLPEAFTTGSSIMPHKRNPDVMELIRAKCNLLLSTPVRVQSLLINMQTGYHRDYQLLKEIIFPAMHSLLEIVEILNYCIPEIIETGDILRDTQYDTCFTVEAIHELIAGGMPFRDAYHQVKEAVSSGKFKVNSRTVNHTHVGSIGNLSLDRIQAKLDRWTLLD